MTEFDPAPSSEDARQRWHGDTDTFGRVYDVLLGITTSTAYTDVAELANCSPNAAKKHLERLTEMGIARSQPEDSPARYRRNDGYLEWQDASRIASDQTVEEIIERVAELEARRSEFEECYSTTDPQSVSVFDLDDHEAVHERMAEVSKWQGIVRDIRLYELARRLAQNDGHLISA